MQGVSNEVENPTLCQSLQRMNETWFGMRVASGEATRNVFTTALVLTTFDVGEDAWPYFWVILLIFTFYAGYQAIMPEGRSSGRKFVEAIIGFISSFTSYFCEILLVHAYTSNKWNLKYPVVMGVSVFAALSAAVNVIPTSKHDAEEDEAPLFDAFP